MWDVIFVIAIILLIRYLFGGSSESAVIPEANATMEILKKATVVKRNRSSKPLSDVLNECDIVAIYFSAHWCPPCRMFTPALADVYKQLKDQGKKFEVIFVSSDKEEDAMYSYMEETHGDWYAISYSDSARSELSSHFGIRSIPTLIVLKKDGTVISREARSEVQGKGAGAWDVWTAASK